MKKSTLLRFSLSKGSWDGVPSIYPETGKCDRQSPEQDEGGASSRPRARTPGTSQEGERNQESRGCRTGQSITKSSVKSHSSPTGACRERPKQNLLSNGRRKKLRGLTTHCLRVWMRKTRRESPSGRWRKTFCDSTHVFDSFAVFLAGSCRN